MVINGVRGSVLIISSSGMASGGLVLHHLRRRLPDLRTTVILVGSQAVETLGRQLADGARTVRILGDDVRACAYVESVEGPVRPRGSDGLLRWLTGATPPRRVFVVHGDPAPMKS